jgi:hypothetical protein
MKEGLGVVTNSTEEQCRADPEKSFWISRVRTETALSFLSS